MSNWPSMLALPDPLVALTPHCAVSVFAGGVGGSPGSATYPTANMAIFYPFRLGRPFLVRLLYVLNGSTASGNIDVGIYDERGTRLVSAGSTAQAGTSAIQTFNVTDTLLGQGQFFLAIALDNTTGTVVRNVVPNAVVSASAGIALQNTAFPLPAVATLARGTSHFLCIGASSRGFV